jgi:hypothetical protein
LVQVVQDLPLSVQMDLTQYFLQSPQQVVVVAVVAQVAETLRVVMVALVVDLHSGLLVLQLLGELEQQVKEIMAVLVMEQGTQSSLPQVAVEQVLLEFQQIRHLAMVVMAVQVLLTVILALL